MADERRQQAETYGPHETHCRLTRTEDEGREQMELLLHPPVVPPHCIHVACYEKEAAKLPLPFPSFLSPS